MKQTILFFILFFTFQFTSFAQDWHYDLSEAQQIAKKENKKIIAVFSGSDWCAPCIRMERKYWNSPEFQAYAKDHFVMLRVDFPRKKKNRLPEEQMEKNYEMVEKYNPENYLPFVVVMDANAQVLGKTGYQKISVKEMIELLESF